MIRKGKTFHPDAAILNYRIIRALSNQGNRQRSSWESCYMVFLFAQTSLKKNSVSMKADGGGVGHEFLQEVFGTGMQTGQGIPEYRLRAEEEFPV